MVSVTILGHTMMRYMVSIAKNITLLVLLLTWHSCASDGNEEEELLKQEIEDASASETPAVPPAEDPADNQIEAALPATAEPAVAEDVVNELDQVANQVADTNESADSEMSQLVDTSSSTQNMPSTEGARVWYVRANSAALRSSPSLGAARVGWLKQGEHFFAAVNDGWVKVPWGGYVSASVLTTSPVGYSKKRAAWK